MNPQPPSRIAAIAGSRSRKRARGATLLEAIAYLSVAAIVTIGAVALFGVSFRGATAARLTDEINAIATNVRGLYSLAGSGGYGALSMTDLYHHGAFPGTLQGTQAGSNVTLTNAWNGAVTVTLNGNGLPVLTYTNIPKDVCAAVLVSSGNWVSLSVNNVAQPTTGLTAVQAAAACSNKSNTLAWGFS